MEKYNEILAQVNGLKSRLRDTDHTANQIIESLVEAMQDATALDFAGLFLEWLRVSVETYGPTIRARAQWRAAVRELERQLEEAGDGT